MNVSIPAAASIALSGDLAWPSRDGEPVFAEPWQGRVFGLAMDVVERSGVGWDAFRQQLIAAITADPQRPYFSSWTVALEQLVVDESLIESAEVDHHRSDAASYRYLDDTHRDIEVYPIDATTERVAAALVRHLSVPPDDVAHWRQFELYRVWDVDAPSLWGWRAFDERGEIAVDVSVSAGDDLAGVAAWDTLCFELLQIVVSDD